MQELRLQSYHDFDGALFRNEAGWSVPAGYRSVDAEARVARTRAGMVDLSDRAKIALTGSERVPFLDGLVTPDLKILTPGTSAYGLLLNEKSRVLGDLRVYALPDSLVLDIEAAQKDRVLGILEKARVSDDVEFRDLGPAGHLEVLGPNADSTIGSVLGVEARGISRHAFLTVTSGRDRSTYVGQGIVARGTYVGQVRRKLLGLRVDGDLAPVHGDRVSNGGREVGFVTSAAWSPSLGGVIALAILRVDAVTPHGVLFIDRGGWALRARLSTLPFL